MAPAPAGFDFYAPTPQPVDYSPLIQGTVAGAQAILSASENVAQSIARAADVKREEERQKKIEKFSSNIASPDNYTEVPYRLGDTMFPDIFDDHTTDDAQKKSAVVERLTSLGYDEAQANSIAEVASHQGNARVLTPEGRSKVSSSVAKALAAGLSAQDAETILQNVNAYDSVDAMRMSQAQATAALMKPSEMSMALRMQIEKETNLALLAEQGKQRMLQIEAQAKIEEKASRLQFGLAKEMQRYKADLEALTVPALQQKLMELQDMYASKRAQEDYSFKRQLTEYEGEIRQRLQELEGKQKIEQIKFGGELEKDIELTKLNVKAAAEQFGPPASEVERKAIDVLFGSIEGDNPSPEVPLTSAIYGAGNTQEATTRLNQQLGLNLDYQNADIIQQIMVAFDPSAPDNVRVDLPDELGAGGTLNRNLEQSVRELLRREPGGTPAELVAISQWLGTRGHGKEEFDKLMTSSHPASLQVRDLAVRQLERVYLQDMLGGKKPKSPAAGARAGPGTLPGSSLFR